MNNTTDLNSADLNSADLNSADLNSADLNSADLNSALVGFINAEISTAPDPVTSDTDLLLTGAVDSLGVVRITQWLEDNYGTDVDPLDVTLENFQTIERMVAFVASKQG